MAQPIIHHRTPQFSAVFAEVQDGLRELFETTQDVLMLAASGTGAMEGRGHQPALAGRRGARRQRRQVRRALERRSARPTASRSHELKVEWGRAVEPDRRRDARSTAHPKARAVLMQASETSTTALHPVAAIAELTRERDTLLVVDGITAVGVLDLPMDRWGIDVLRHRLAEGAHAAARPRVHRALRARLGARPSAAKLPRFYFDFRSASGTVAQEHDGVDAGDLADHRARAKRSRMMLDEGLAERASRATTAWRARRAPARDGARPRARRARRAEPGGDRRLRARRRRRRQRSSPTCATAWASPSPAARIS